MQLEPESPTEPIVETGARFHRSIDMRLRRIEGQVRGIGRMADERRACLELLQQVSAARAGLRSILLMLAGHQITHDIEAGPPEDINTQLHALSNVIAPAGE